jgi:predicted peptidase
MGLSMGGMGTFEILARNPEMFAAAVPICGGGNPEMADRYATSTAIWIFHGAKDNVVAPEFSTTMLQAIQNAGGQPAITIFPDANHNSWDPAFAEPELLPWLFSKSKSE